MTDETDTPQGGAEGVEPEAVDTKPEATTGQPEAAAEEAAPADDAGEVAGKPKQVPWFQKRINEVTAQKYDAEREASYWKGIAEGRGTPQAQEPAAETELRLEDFNWDEAAFAKAVREQERKDLDKVVERRLSEREVQLTETQKNDTAIAKLKEGGAKHPDFIAAVSGVKASEAVRDFLLDDDNAPTILYELGKDSQAVERFNSLSPVQQAIELGKRAATPKATTRTIPPPPPETVAGLVSGIGKTPEQMDMAEYAAWVKERDKT